MDPRQAEQAPICDPVQARVQAARAQAGWDKGGMATWESSGPPDRRGYLVRDYGVLGNGNGLRRHSFQAANQLYISQRDEALVATCPDLATRYWTVLG